MKKVIFLLSVFSLILTSCSTDDDNGSSQDPFIGTWKFSQSFENGVEQALRACADLETIVISSNGTFTATGYDDFGDGCELDFSQSGTWENSGSGMYAITEDDETFIIQVGFEGNTMYFEEIDEGVTYKDVYVRQ